MRHDLRAWTLSLAVIGMAAAFSTTGAAQPPQQATAARFDISPPLGSIQPLAVRGDEQREHPVRLLPLPPAPRGGVARDARAQRAATRRLAASAPVSFEGLGEGPNFRVGVAPPDTTGAAGPTQYVQWVNGAFAVFDKKSGKTLYGPAAGNTLWSNFEGPCQKLNDGDPIVLYDRLAGRWLLSQFAVTDGPPYFECIAVSRTSDALGPYARYAFQYDDFNDYPKFGVWPNGYYVSYNMFNKNDEFIGSKACALQRDMMLAGQQAHMQCFDVNAAGLLPSDLDGSRPPPAGSPNYLLNFGTNRLNLWRFTVDWSNPANSRLVGPTAVAVSPFRPGCGGRACIPQPPVGGAAGTRLDSLGDRLMFRLAYRNHGPHQSLVVNHTVDVPLAGGKVVQGVRWYELRNPGGTPVVRQQGTFAPDEASRWIGSIATDKMGNILLGYSVASGTLHPSIRLTGRGVGDPPNTMAAESDVIVGKGSQTIVRWGDYASVVVDPDDDCTFWFSTQYLEQDGKFNWRTKVARTRFPTCK